MSPLSLLGLLTISPDVLIKTRTGRVVSGVIEITASGIASFKAFIERMPDPLITPAEVDHLLRDRVNENRNRPMEW